MAIKQDSNTPLFSGTNTFENVTVTNTLVAPVLSTKQDKLTEQQLKAVNSGISDETVATIQSNKTRITTVESYIPSATSTENFLANRDFVNSSIQSSTAQFRGNWATYAAVPTDAEEYPEDPSGKKKPASGDYLVIQQDENHSNECWRYKYVGDWDTIGKTGWKAEYKINESPLTDAQVKALNSTITVEKVTEYNTHINNMNIHITEDEKATWNAKQDALSTVQLNAVNSGITEDKVLEYDTLQGQISTKQDSLTETQLEAVNSGINTTKVSTYDNYATLITNLTNTKQNNLSETQLTATNSGITAEKVAKYDSFEYDISNKQDKLNETQLTAVNSGITADKVNQITTNTTNIESLTNSKQDKLNETQLAAVNSGITSTIVTNLQSSVNNHEERLTTAESTLTTKLDKVNVVSKGSADTPVYFDADGKAQPITSFAGKADTSGTADKVVYNISFLNANNQTINYNGEVAVDLTGGLYYAKNAYTATEASNYVVGGTIESGLNTKETKLTSLNAGEGIQITRNETTDVVTISNTNTAAIWGNITGTLSNQSDLNTALNSKASASDVSTLTERMDTAEGAITSLTNDKADKADTLDGYGITDAYTKQEVDDGFLEADTELANKLVKSNVEDNIQLTLKGSKNTEMSSVIIPKFSGSNTMEDGASGLVPKPLIADKDKFLKADGTWANTTSVTIRTWAAD